MFTVNMNFEIDPECQLELNDNYSWSYWAQSIIAIPNYYYYYLFIIIIATLIT